LLDRSEFCRIRERNAFKVDALPSFSPVSGASRLAGELSRKGVAVKLFLILGSASLVSVFGALACSAGSSSQADKEATGAGAEEPGNGAVDPGVLDPGGGGEIDPLQGEDPADGCGNGMLDPMFEACDDGNNVDGDGCWANCLKVETGFICKTPGEACDEFAKCGDGVRAFPEQCDDGAREVGDGCNENCKLELGYKCDDDAAGVSVCSETTCGDGKVEGAEMCEIDQEGCTSQCQFAPNCSGDGACTSECGDGLVLGEACDDGNRLDGDGCTKDCVVEPGYTCGVQMGDCERAPNGECILRVPVTYRDFDSSHSDFEANTCQGGQVIVPGLAGDRLVAGKPVSTTGQDCTSGMADWYSDAHPAAKTIHSELVLYETAPGSGAFVNRYGAAGEKWHAPEMNAGVCACGTPGGCDYDGNPLFFPVDSLGTGAGTEAGLTPDYGICWTDEPGVSGHTNTGPHNFHFTSEVTYWFPYNEDTNATLDFNGDDDLWVFVNGQLAVDVGGIHPPQNGSVTILGSTPAYGMTPGNVYEIKVFHAERRTKGSTFKLTLSGFNARRSDCTAECGDGIIGFGEECDDGVNAGGYNGCDGECKLGAYCGDGVKQENETCDDADPAAPSGCSGCNVVVVR